MQNTKCHRNNKLTLRYYTQCDPSLKKFRGRGEGEWSMPPHPREECNMHNIIMTQITTVQTVLLTFPRIQSSYWKRILLFRMQAKNYNLQIHKIHSEKVPEY